MSGSLPLAFDAAYQYAARYNGQYPKIARSITAGQIFRLPAETQNEQDDTSLTSSQRALSIGDPVPIVFARRVGNNGGIFISPGATEARFSTTVEYNVIIQNQLSQIAFVLNTSYHLVLSEGEIDSIPVKDVFQGTRRTGTHTQTFDRRAGTWTPGNFVSVSPYDSSPTPDCPEICGSVGLYPRISTLSFSVSTRYGRTDSWKFQVHVFIRGGMYVNRLLDNVFGPSNNFADLVKWAMQNIKRLSDASIDNTSLLKVAQFLEVNQFTCNAYFTEAVRYEALLEEWGPYFLTQPTRNNGKEGLRSLLPLNADGTINTGPIEWAYTFDESQIAPGSLDINYTPLAERLPFVAQIIWRQQPDGDLGITRTLEVNYNNLALDGPYEKHDLSAFCTNENHAAKVGAYIVSTRANVSHTIDFTAVPGPHSPLLKGGDIIRVVLNRTASGSAESRFIYLYRIVQIVKDVAGSVSYSCVHFPTDSQGRSTVAVDVSNAVGTGYIMPSRSGINKDDSPSRKDDGTVPPESYIQPGDYTDPSTWDSPYYQWYKDGVAIPGATGPTYTPTASDVGSELSVEIGYPDGTTNTSDPIFIDSDAVGNPINLDGGLSGGTSSAVDGGGSISVGDGGGIDEGTGSAVTEDESQVVIPTDGLDGQQDAVPSKITTEPEGAAVGLPLSVNITCAGGTVQWFRNGVPISGATAQTYTPSGDDIGTSITSQITCPEGTQTTTDPVTPFNPILDFSTYGAISGNIDIVYLARDVRTFYKGSSGNTPVCDIQSTLTYNSGSTLLTNVSVSAAVKFRPATISQVNGAYLSASISYDQNTCPNQVATLSRNGAIVRTQADGTEAHNSAWGSNLSTATYNGVTSYHYTIITAFRLSTAVPGLGSAGEDVIRKGMAHYIVDIGSPKDTGLVVTGTGST